MNIIIYSMADGDHKVCVLHTDTVNSSKGGFRFTTKLNETDICFKSNYLTI